MSRRTFEPLCSTRRNAYHSALISLRHASARLFLGPLHRIAATPMRRLDPASQRANTTMVWLPAFRVSTECAKFSIDGLPRLRASDLLRQSAAVVVVESQHRSRLYEAHVGGSALST